jgi:TonB family protein
MRLVVPVILVAACGGKSTPAPAAPAPVTVKAKPTRVPIEDSEVEEGVTVLNARGRMDQAAVEAGLAPHKEALSECYTTRVGKRRWLGGHVVLHWDIKASGTISSVKLSESDLGAWEVEKCLLEVAREATFAKPIGGDADFTVPLDFSAKGGSQIWDEDKGLRAVGGQLAKLDQCFDESKPAKPVKPVRSVKPAKGHAQAPAAAPTNVTITLYVGPHGKAQSVGFSSATSEIVDEWAGCAAKAALAWRLPDPRGQIAKLAVRYKGEAHPGEASR